MSRTITVAILLLVWSAPALTHHGAESGPPTAAPGATPQSAIGEALNDDSQNRLARALATGHVWPVIVSFLGFGALLAFSPGVLPMIAILASVMMDRGSGLTTRHAFTLSLIYVLAVSVTLAASGAAASLFELNLQIPFQTPWVLSGFAAAYVLLSLALFGFYRLRVPASLHHRLARLSRHRNGGAYLGAGIMGVMSAFIIGPVVAGPLANALVYIGQSDDPLLGAAALFALSAGMSVPVLMLGSAAARLLTLATPWITALKGVLGVLMIAVAIHLAGRLLPAWTTMLLWAGLLIVCAIYMGALEVVPSGASGWRRLWKGAGWVMLTYGVLLIVGVAAGGGDLLQPLRGLGI